MSEELKPCPFCGKPVHLEGGDAWHNQHSFFIKCRNPECGCACVGDTEKNECVERWNALPRRPRWTNVMPTAPGWYWFKGAHGIKVAEVCFDSRRPGELYSIIGRGGNWLSNRDGQWTGPLEIPADDEEGGAEE